MSILDKIVQEKRRELIVAKAARSLEQIRAAAEKAPKPRGFVESLKKTKQPSIIAEIKRASPSKGILRADLDPIETAIAYTENGAACISVLTDRSFFSGENAYVEQVREMQKSKFAPILRKEFIIDSYQVWETLCLGADALLLIVAILDEDSLLSLATEACSAGLDILIEVHNDQELQSAVAVLRSLSENKTTSSRFALGINNRDLNTFVTSLETTKKLAQQARSALGQLSDTVPLVAESGISNANDLKLLRSYGADAFLIGETLVAKGAPGKNLATLIREFQQDDAETVHASSA